VCLAFAPSSAAFRMADESRARAIAGVQAIFDRYVDLVAVSRMGTKMLVQVAFHLRKRRCLNSQMRVTLKHNR
jgi:hypothetical protein